MATKQTQKTRTAYDGPSILIYLRDARRREARTVVDRLWDSVDALANGSGVQRV
jgi:hypothetical protein